MGLEGSAEHEEVASASSMEDMRLTPEVDIFRPA